jgi:glycosyltransferase involved in cell wall biosynthesis
MKFCVMVGTDYEGKGGIASVVKTYKLSGLFDRLNIRYIASHREGSTLKKIAVFLKGLVNFLILCSLNRVSLCHLQTASYGSFSRKYIFFFLAKLFGVKTVLHIHGAEFELFYREKSFYFQKKMIQHALRRADLVIVLSEQWRKQISKICLKANIQVLHNPIDPALFVNDKRHDSTLLFLGEIGRRKGIYDVIDTLPKIISEYPNLKLIVAGTGEINQARLHCQTLGVESNVVFTGWIVGTKKEQLLRESTLLLLPSYNEGLPMSILEAMAVGLPVVASKIGGIPEALAGVENYCLVEPGEKVEITEKILFLLANPKIRSKVALHLRTSVEEKFSVRKINQQLIQIYQHLISDG